ncbi:transketolase [Gaoshiqia sediminis]|uniref:Transketolase n=1 Tax=Gaoshiqia sediminis TaxID=2986998 RepID=A0AA41Y612_9BACT|nr:transketolase [Gaoshiqia sediminis]MCW0481777.1 transketolase [Gaoshiqia sediminis]
MKKYTNLELKQKSIHLRKALLKYIKLANAGHTGGDLSCIDILNVLYNDVLNVSPETVNDPNRDRYIQSKGHAVEALYVVLADAGFFPMSELETLCKYQSKYVGHPTRKVKGIEFNTGALGHGLPISAGLALAAKKDGAPYRVFTMLGDGELAEGSNWEAAMMAAHYKLDNLVAILDHNTLQITGRNVEVCSPHPIAEKWLAFGWNVIEVNGHDFEQLREVLNAAPAVPRKPTFVLANTVKGKGISFMEDVKKWHHGVPSDEEYEKALTELDAQLAR